MDPQKVEKTVKDAKLFAIILLVFNLILFLMSLSNGLMTPLSILIRCSILAILFKTIYGYSNNKSYGPICGIIVSILIILNLDILDVILGVIYLYENASLMKYFNN